MESYVHEECSIVLCASKETLEVLRSVVNIYIYIYTKIKIDV